VDFNFIAGLFSDVHAKANPFLKTELTCVFDECGDVDVAKIIRSTANPGTEYISCSYPDSAGYDTDRFLGFFLD